MIALWLIASHMVGDFVLQSRWHAAGKLTDAEERVRHVLAYTLAFLPVTAAYTHAFDGHAWRSPHGEAWTGILFLLFLGSLHYVTDSVRFKSTLGDVLGWRLRRHLPERDLAARGEEPVPVSPPPNPWKPTALLIDQTLHIVQIAALAGIFLEWPT